MDPTYDPRVKPIISTPQGYENFYRRGFPPSDFLSPGRSAVLPGEATADELQAIYRALSSSPERMPPREIQMPPARRFDWMAEAPRPGARPTGFPLELLEGAKPGMFPRVNPMVGAGANLIPILLQLGGSTDPNIAQWRAERSMVTPPEQARSVPDRLQELAALMAQRRGRE